MNAPNKVTIAPASKKQEMYITNKCDVVIFGGGKQSSAAYKLC